MKSFKMCSMFMYKSTRKNSEISDNDRFKTKKEKKRINYYIDKLNEFERLMLDD